MPKIIVIPHEKICPEGAELEIESGSNLCRSLLDHGVLKTGFGSLDEMDDVEADLLDRAWGLTAQSRLSCQVKVQDENLEVEIPKYTVNYISEGH